MIILSIFAALLPLLSDAAGLTVLDRPLWVFPGQLFRVCLQQPAGAGPLTTPVPANLQQVDAWDQDAIQRFYFRATAPGTAQLVFTGAAGRLAYIMLPGAGHAYHPAMTPAVVNWIRTYLPLEKKPPAFLQPQEDQVLS